jgi:hypothetical protein
MEATFVNYTPHDVNLILGEGLTLTIPRSGETVRVTDERNVVDTVNVDGHPVEIRRVSYGEAYLINRDGDRRPLPDKQEGTVMLVSALAGTGLLAVGRTDFLIVDGLVRDENGRPLGATGFATMS